MPLFADPALPKVKRRKMLPALDAGVKALRQAAQEHIDEDLECSVPDIFPTRSGCAQFLLLLMALENRYTQRYTHQ